jgi:hypothetical protein
VQPRGALTGRKIYSQSLHFTSRKLYPMTINNCNAWLNRRFGFVAPLFGGCSNTLRDMPNAHMQGAQKPNREAYIDIHWAVRFAAQHSRPWCPSGYERIVKPSAFSGKESVHLIITLPCGNALSVNSPISLVNFSWPAATL